MARTTKPLTNTEVKQAKPKEKIYTLSNGGGLVTSHYSPEPLKSIGYRA